MKLKLDLARVFFRIGERSMEQAGLRLREGRGFRGPLSPKDRPDGRPLGFAGSGRGLPGALEEGTLRVYPLGFSVRYDEANRSGARAFHGGRRKAGQVARPVFGMSGKARLEAREAVTDEVLAQTQAQIRQIKGRP